jgi:serine/threonine protein kinase
MKRKKTNSIERELIHNEINILQVLNHKSIVKMKDVFFNSSHTLIVEELLDGGSLENYIGLLTENDIKIVAEQLLNVISYIHEVGVIHRDIKLDNVLLAEKSDVMTVKLADFGLSVFALPGKVLSGICGTVGYTAPEMYGGDGYGNEVDMWSFGVLLYIMLLKKMPFSGNCNQDIIEATINKEPDFGELARTSPQAVEFIKKLLMKNPKDRTSAVDARKHEWFNG